MSGPLRTSIPTRSAPAANGQHPASVAASPLSTRVRPKGYAALAVALLVGCGALGFWLYTSAGHKVPVVEAGRNIAVGHVINRSDLTTVEIAGDVTAVGGDHLGSLIGQRASVGIRQGTPIQRSMVSTGSIVPTGYALVGVSVSPGQIPSSGLVPGDSVEVLQLPQKGVDGTPTSASAVLVRTATVYDVRANISTSGGSLLTLVTPQVAAYGVAQASNGGVIALIKIGG